MDSGVAINKHLQEIGNSFAHTSSLQKRSLLTEASVAFCKSV